MIFYQLPSLLIPPSSCAHSVIKIKKKFLICSTTAQQEAAVRRAKWAWHRWATTIRAAAATEAGQD